METVKAYDPHANLQGKVAELSARMTRLEDAFYWHVHGPPEQHEISIRPGPGRRHPDDEPEAEPEREGEREARE